MDMAAGECRAGQVGASAFAVDAGPGKGYHGGEEERPDMFDALKRLLTGTTPGAPPALPGESEEERLQVAACVLLLELAHADEDFSPPERQRIEASLARHFDLPPEGVRELIELAEARRRNAIDLQQFTSVLTAAYDEGQRLLLAEIMWRVVDADGTLSDQEEMLLRKLGRLLDLRPGFLSVARKRAGGAAGGGAGGSGRAGSDESGEAGPVAG
jgi:uncharacterized tellurite resistance protein B-like protein